MPPPLLLPVIVRNKNATAPPNRLLSPGPASLWFHGRDSELHKRNSTRRCSTTRLAVAPTSFSEVKATANDDLPVEARTQLDLARRRGGRANEPSIGRRPATGIEDRSPPR